MPELMQMKQWVMTEAERLLVTPKTIWRRIERGKYRGR